MTNFLLGVVLFYVGLTGVLFFLQRSMIYFPDRRSHTPQTWEAPAFSAVHTHTQDELSLEGWYAPPRSARSDCSVPVLLWFHGNAGHHGMRSLRVGHYLAQGYGVLLAGYRGYGGNAGRPSEKGLMDDARAWIRFLEDSGVPLSRIVLYGESLGSGIAVQMAVEYPDVRALILESPYTSLPDVAARTWFFIPVHLLMKDRYDSLSKIAGIRTPLLILQGENDTIVPAVQGQRLYRAAPDPKDILTLPHYGHNDLPSPVLAARVMAFLGGDCPEG